MTHILLIAVFGYLLVVGCVFTFQRSLMYHPDKKVGPPSRYNLTDYSEFFISAQDHETLQFWYHPPAGKFPTIVYYHGNSYTLGDRADIFAKLSGRGFGVLAVSYRGYGKSTGSPTEQGIYTDARTAMNYAHEMLHLPFSNIILFGESLGTGVAVQMATEYDVGGVVIQSPYTSVAARAAEIYSYIPVEFLIKDKYYTINKIGNITAPLLIFHGELDQVIPVEHGRAVFAAAKEPKEAIFFPDKGHNDFDSDVISEHVLHFAEKHHLIAQ